MEQHIAPFVFVCEIACRFPKSVARNMTHILNNLDAHDADAETLALRAFLTLFLVGRVESSKNWFRI